MDSKTKGKAGCYTVPAAQSKKQQRKAKSSSQHGRIILMQELCGILFDQVVSCLRFNKQADVASKG